MEERVLTADEKKELLEIARTAVSLCIEGRQVDIVSDLPALREKRGVFVTLHKATALRGCIGVFSSDKPLYRAVAEMALCAAFKDPRFMPVSPEELDEVDFEISALSPLWEIDDIGEIKVGTHGICITKGSKKGVLLPQVATEYGWDRETFVEHTCLKAGLPRDAWREGARIEVFSAQVFGEKEEI